MITFLFIWLQGQSDAQFLLDILRYFAWTIVSGEEVNEWLLLMPKELIDHVFEVGKAIAEALF